MNKTKAIYWVSTSLFVLLVAVPALVFFNSEMSKEGFRQIGFPEYFRIELYAGKVLGGLLLILPFLNARIKEWTYVAYGIDMISAAIAIVAVMGFTAEVVSPLIGLALLAVSYFSWYRMRGVKVF